MKECKKLIHNYFADELTPDEIQSLKAWLHEDSSHIDQFVREALLHRQLIDAMTSKRMFDKSIADLNLPGLPLCDENETLFGDSLGPTDSFTSWFGWSGMLPKFALVLCVLALIAAPAIWMLQPQTPSDLRNTTQATPTEETILKVRDNAVASMETLGLCTWKSEPGISPSNDKNAMARLESGRTLHLLEGKARVSFDCGAVLTLTGPSSLRIDSRMDATLLDGRVSAVVSQEAIGFLLHTNEMDVRDLGTEFDVHVDPQNGTKVQVVDGKVEADLPSRLGHDKETVSLTQGQYIRAENKQSVAVENLTVFHGMRIDFDRPNSLGLFTIQRPDANLYQLDLDAGELLLDTTFGSVYGRMRRRGKNLFLLPVSGTADLDIVLTVSHFEPQTVIEHIGLLCMADEDNYARIIYAKGNGNYMKFTIEKYGAPSCEVEEPIDFGNQPFKLRLTRRGNEIASWWSIDDGKHWGFRDKSIAPPNAKYVGFYVANALRNTPAGSRVRIERFEVECSE